MATAVLAVVFAAVATLADTGVHLPPRYFQHEQAQHLADLPEADRAAASSTSIDPATFASHLPVVSIDTRGQEIPGERIASEGTAEEGTESTPTIGEHSPVTVAADGRTTIPTSFSLFSTEGAANRLTDEPALDSHAELRIRGHSSRWFDKKSYLVHFTEQDRLTERNLDVLGMGAEEEWVLNGPFLDKALLRNYLALNLAGQIMPFTPDVRFCELFLDGQYQGVYLLMESVKHGDDRVVMRDSDPKSAATSYLICRDWNDDTSDTNIYDLLDDMRITRGAPLEVMYPSSANLTPEQFEWIASDINAIEKALYSYDYDTSRYGYWNTLDVDSFVNYAVINEFAGNLDAGSYSTFFYKDIRGKLSAGPVWDFNNAFDNYAERSSVDDGFFMAEKPLYVMLYKDEAFVDAVIKRYRELRQGVLSDESLDALIDGASAYLGPAVDRNYEVWGYSFDPAAVNSDNKLVPDERNPSDYAEALAQLKEAIRTRGAWLDRNIENLKQYSHESVNKRFNH